ncbi:GNAT family N-acetyltransferase [Actinocorallia sp. API 0066]|uniref:GNAT family N-acetyltransferase n=1 Tax=Actinocorallia sp. API 0066 TaxID=2896846 RepID=UPI001E4B8FD6|nr:GNAT family N-acetyltransferase [Actinocorallia sp. API 0066]MCD0452384.1 GNAT family N-acetyltransferase [Actinocorallia sp. API 0066]
MIRKFRLDDEYAVYDICLRTATDPDGYDDPRLVGHVYVGPYLRFEPQFASVVDEGAVLGYIVGTPDTRAFEERCAQDWWPNLRRRYPEDPASPSTRDERMIHIIHHPFPAPEEIVREHPSHLHINLLAETRGKGYGRALIDQFLGELVAAGSPGVHFGVDPANTNALAFYAAVGFDVLRTNVHTVWMGRRL